jgi:phage repressor protein C with HTH and peptisase S24 domain
MSGKELKEKLQAAGVNLAELSRKMGYKTDQNLHSVLGAKEMSSNVLERMADAMGKPIGWFYADDEPEEQLEPVAPNSVPLLPIFAQAGSLTGWSEGIEEVKCERVISPVNGIDMAVHIYGESMYPDIPNGSVVYVKKISGRIIDFGKPYILDTVDGPLLKYVAPGHDDGFVKCISANHDPMYAPFEVSKTDIIGMYRVVMCMSMK